MSGKIVNLRLARKRKTREDSAQQGNENAARHGASKAVRQLEAKEGARSERALDGKRLGDGDAGADRATPDQ